MLARQRGPPSAGAPEQRLKDEPQPGEIYVLCANIFNLSNKAAGSRLTWAGVPSHPSVRPHQSAARRNMQSITATHRRAVPGSQSLMTDAFPGKEDVTGGDGQTTDPPSLPSFPPFLPPHLGANRRVIMDSGPG